MLLVLQLQCCSVLQCAAFLCARAEVGASWVLWLSRLQSVWTCGFWVQSAPCALTLQEPWGRPLSLGRLCLSICAYHNEICFCRRPYCMEAVPGLPGNVADVSYGSCILGKLLHFSSCAGHCCSIGCMSVGLLLHTQYHMYCYAHNWCSAVCTFACFPNWMLSPNMIAANWWIAQVLGEPLAMVDSSIRGRTDCWQAVHQVLDA